jgi:hypothetical protein
MGLTTKQKSDLAKTIAILTKEAHGKTGAGVPMVYCAAERDALIGVCAANAAAVLDAAEEKFATQVEMNGASLKLFKNFEARLKRLEARR